MKRTLTAMEARRKFGEMLEDVRRGDEVMIERAGKVMGVLIPPERYAVIEQHRERLWKTVDLIRDGFRDLTDDEVERLVDEEVRAVRRKSGSKRRTA